VVRVRQDRQSAVLRRHARPRPPGQLRAREGIRIRALRLPLVAATAATQSLRNRLSLRL
jgi:hypothetical protein